MILQLLAATNLGKNIPHLEASQGTLENILNAIYVIIGALAVIFIIVGAIRYVLSAGDSAKLAQAKNTILYAILGLIISILAFAITNFVIGSIDVSSFTALRDSIVRTLFSIIGSIAVIVIVYGGFRYVTSAGDSSKIAAAKNTILYAVIGLIIAILAFAIVNFVIGAL